MRTNSEIFDSYNQAPQRELRLVVVIDYDLPLYLTSHDDIEGLPANAILGCLQKVSSTSQRLYPEDGRAEIGSISFDVVDRSGQFSYVLRDELDNGRSIKGLTVRLYSGFKGLHWDDFRLEQTQIAEESVSYAQGGKYSVRCRDIQRVMREDIFTLNSTRLSANFLKGASTLHVFDTSGFEPNPHTAAYGDAPNQSVYYLKIKYSDGYEIVRATGKTDTTFTGVTRGLFGTVDRDHMLEEGADPEESGIEVDEYVYLEGPAPALAYMLLTGNIPGTTDTLPSNWHLGIDPQWVNLEEFENIGSDLFKPGDYTKGKILRFDGLEETDGKKFIETEINLCTGTYMPVRADGKLGCRRMSGVLANAGTVATITPDDVTSVGDLKYDLSGVRNVYQIQWSWYQSPTDDDGKYLRTNTLIDAESIQTHGEAKSHTLKFRGLHNSRHTFTTIKNTFDALRDRFAGPPLSLRLGLLPSKNDLEVGDIVRVSLPQVRDHSINGDQPYQWNFTDGTDGWEAHRATATASNGVLAVTATDVDHNIRREFSADEQFQGADYPILKLRTRRTGAEPIPTTGYIRLYWTRDGVSGYPEAGGTELIDLINRMNAAPGEWQELTLDLSGNPAWTDYQINMIRLDIGHDYVADYSYDVDYIRLLSTSEANYLHAIEALTDYLDGLSPAWDDTTSITTIDRSEWDAKWSDVYTARQALLSDVSAALKQRAEAAQSTADSAVQDAAAAQSAADAAQQDATEALGELGNIGSDSKLHPSEKLILIREYNELTDEQSGIVAQATDLGITTEKTAYNNAISALTSYLGGLSPAWDNTGSVTSITRSTWDSKWQDVYSTRQALLDKISAVLKTRADNAQTTADDAASAASDAQSAADAAQADATQALGELGNIGADNKLHPSEKLIIIREYNEIIGEQSGIESEAESYGIATEKTAYTDAISSLTGYLNGLSPAWNNTGAVTTINRTTWNSKWADVYGARQVLLNKIANTAGQWADWSKITGVGKPEDGATVGATTAERILIESSAGIFLESFSDPNALENWEIPVGDGSAWVISSSTARVGGRNLYIGDNSGDDEAWLHSRLRIPFESEKLYRVEMRVYQESSGDPSGRVYLGVAGFDRDGNYCNKNGDAVLANSYYVAANGAQNTGAGWVVYYGYIRGFGSINGSNGGQSLASPGLMHPNVRYISPLVVANYSGVSGRTRVDYCRIDVIQVRDQRDLPQNVSAQASLPTSSAVLSASDAGSSAKINIAAHTVQYGGFTVNYNSGSISGLSYETKYYVYVDDPDYSGGSVTYQVTTEIWQLAAGIGRRAIGTITTPTSGGSSTAPTLPWCVADGVWLRDNLLAEDCAVGDLLDCWDTGDTDTHLSPIQAVKSQDDVPCVTITTESGAQVICSRETPVTDEQGIVYLAQDCLGVSLGVLHEDEPMTWERVIAVECAGLRRVNKISVGGISYAAGVHPQHRVITHNIMYKP
ncbi:hypothetical protein OQJ68_10740 [Microbulbifer thermotolerans]|uniref:Uncharacterized protein n=1 Tax=Microbulbifer thermotolerans TaxID=252514 RepID=A0AB35I0F7_MICTH|nr:hypothetical protein [Microbulbifer thermotolerans]MCX2802262.1 hypothetical protein [Microbulbifer thermotolerans]